MNTTLTLYRVGFFVHLKDRGEGGFLAYVRKTAIMLHPNHLKFRTTHFWILAKLLTLVKWSKWWCQHYFWWHHQKYDMFWLNFKLFLCLKSTGGTEGTESCSFVGFVQKTLFRIKVSRGLKSPPVWYRVKLEAVFHHKHFISNVKSCIRVCSVFSCCY